jgi:hypothetical protein
VLTISLLTISGVNAQTTIPGGYISGNWTKAKSPYLIQGNITIHTDSTLNIDPGVVINSQGYNFIVNGYLEAVGTKTDSIFFTNAYITFSDARDSSHLIYCSIINTFSPVRCTNSSPVISHCTIKKGLFAIDVGHPSNPRLSHCLLSNANCAIRWSSAVKGTISDCNINNNFRGFYNQGSGTAVLNLVNCTFSNNSGPGPGEGVRSDGGTMNFINCTIRNNSSSDYQGGGVYIAKGKATFTNCIIDGNTTSPLSTLEGGGIFVGNASVILSYCTILNNYAQQGGGIAISGGGNLSLDHCVFDANSYNNIEIFSGCTVNITNCIFSNAPVESILNNGTLTVKYTDFYGNSDGNIGGTKPSGFGVLSNMNYNSDPCDIYNNIFLDPLYQNRPAGDLRITWANFPKADITKSPCIDAGDPEYSSDPDSTITDMGRYFFDQSLPQIALSHSILDFGSVLIGQQADTILKVYNNGLDTLVIHNLFNDKAVFSTGYNPVDSLILPRDSISITITFTPVNTSPVIDTIHIYNNDQDTIVKLIGTGQIPTDIFDPPDVIPQEYLLGQAYPNPFYQVTSFELDLPGRCYVILTVFNMSGDVVSILISKEMEAGRYKYVWNAGNLASGTYLLKLQVGEFNEVRKIVLLK